LKSASSTGNFWPYLITEFTENPSSGERFIREISKAQRQ